mgnify:CR=1 FL=1
MFMYTDYTQHLLDNVKKIHFIGCGGSGMYPLIQILAAKGYDISGSDVLDGSIIRSEREMGVKVTLGHSADNVIGADLVVYSAAIAKDNVELNAAASYGITTVERSVLLGYVSRLYKQSICVSGTHGKTTTTSMITTALELAGRDPSAVIGGKLPLIHGYGKAGKGDDIVIEACEFSETFLKLTPYLSVVLNIDNDHLDYYGSMGELKFAFKRFALMTQFMIFANADDKNTMDVMYTLDRRVRTFGINNDGDYQAVNVQEYKPGFFEFDLKEWSKVTGHIRLAVPGRHNIYNALAMCAVCRFAGLTVEQCAAAAAMALGNLLGLVCDPVAGLVEVPCIKRNVVGAVNAVSCANMALAGVDYAIPCDEVIDAMGRVGSLLSPDLRETGQGGLAATPTGVRIAQTLAEQG